MEARQDHAPCASTSRLRAVGLVALALALPTRGQDAADPATGIEQLAPISYVAKKDDVPVRAEPGLVYHVVARIQQRQGVVVNGRKDEWLRLASGGWVLAEHVWTREEAALAGAQDPDPGSAPPWEVIAASANVRSARGTDSTVVRRLVQGDSVRVLRVVEGWAEVPGGWIREDLIQSPSPTRPSGAALIATPAGPRRWSLLALSGLGVAVYELADRGFVQQINAGLHAAGTTSMNWTVLGITVSVKAGAPTGFDWSPAVTTLVAVDARGEKYGSVFAKGQLERLPPGLAEALGPRVIPPGQSFDGLVLFRPTLAIEDIAELSVRIDGRLLRLVPAM